ncbi:hypothetical protein [Zavarzinia compransoris]|nr:hypothetical protein [Zavarzinia compransoris]TDP46047.1 hypothetical protein DES42_104128 [Zavarzinia compransoris]
MLTLYRAMNQAFAEALAALPADTVLTVGEQLHCYATILGHAVAENVPSQTQDTCVDLLGVTMREACAEAAAHPLPAAGTA